MAPAVWAARVALCSRRSSCGRAGAYAGLRVGGRDDLILLGVAKAVPASGKGAIEELHERGTWPPRQTQTRSAPHSCGDRSYGKSLSRAMEQRLCFEFYSFQRRIPLRFVQKIVVS
jgi:hypothetical protein